MAKKSWSKKLTDGAKNQVVKTVIPKGARKVYKSAKRYKKTKAQKEIDNFRRQVNKAELKATEIKTPNFIMRFRQDIDSSFDKRLRAALKKGPKHLDKFLKGLKKPEEVRMGLVYGRDNAKIANSMLDNPRVASNPDHLLYLTSGKNPMVNKLVLEIKPLNEAIIHSTMRVRGSRAFALGHPDCPSEYLVANKWQNADERTALYSNPKISPEVLATGNPLNYADALGLAQNPNTPHDVMIKIRLEWQKDKLIDMAFARNKGLGKEFKAELDYHNNRNLVMELIGQGVNIILDDMRLFRDEAMVCVLAASSLLNRFYEKKILLFGSPLAIANMAMNPLTSEYTQRKIYQLNDYNEELALNLQLAPDLSLCLQKNGDEDVKVNLAIAEHITVETVNENGETVPLDLGEYEKPKNRETVRMVLAGGCKCRLCKRSLMAGDIGPVCIKK